jgi:hypothetical protein
MIRYAKGVVLGIGALTMLALVANLVAPKTVQAAVAALVFVTNTPDSQPFSQRLDISISGNSGRATFVVPTGKTLVIDYVSSDADIPVGDSILFGVETFLQGNEVEAHLPMVPVGTILGNATFAMSAPVKIYADGGSTVTVFILTSGTDFGGLIVGIYGHFI